MNPGSPKYCGLEIVGGRHLPKAWQNNILTNDFRGNRVCRYVISEDGAGFAARQMPDIIEVTDDPVVSSDVQGNRHSMVFDTQATMKSQGRMVKTISWYDNGWGHAARVLDIIKAYARLNGNGGAA